MPTQLMPGVTMHAEVEVNLSGRQWEIYSAENMAEYMGVSHERAARQYAQCVTALNAAASRALSCGDRSVAWDLWDETANEWSAWGAADSEPYRTFESLVLKVYGRD